MFLFPTSIFPTVARSTLAISVTGVRAVLIISVALLTPLVALIYQLAGFHISLGMALNWKVSVASASVLAACFSAAVFR